MAIKKTTPRILASAVGIAAVGGGLLTSYAAPHDAQPASTYAPGDARARQPDCLPQLPDLAGLPSSGHSRALRHPAERRPLGRRR